MSLNPSSAFSEFVISEFQRKLEAARAFMIISNIVALPLIAAFIVFLVKNTIKGLSIIVTIIAAIYGSASFSRLQFVSSNL